jgi:hypothetical protein
MGKFKIKRGVEANIGNITLDDGEMAITTDSKKLYIGVAGQKVIIADGNALGDMLRGIYDTDDDGVVDQAERVEWSGILNKMAATDTNLGLVKVGSNLSITPEGTLSGNSIPESFIPKSKSFIITGSQTTFNLTDGYYTPGSLTWSIYGSGQPKNSITEITDTSFSIPPGLADGTEFEVQYIQTVNLTPFPYHKSEHLPGGADPLDLANVAISGSYSDLSDKPNINDLSKKNLMGSTTVAGYYAFAQTPINPVEYSAIFKITVTSTANANIGHVLYVKVEGHANTVPIFQVDTKTNNTTAATTGLYYLRGVYPKLVNNGYRSFIELYVYDATKRDIKIELIGSNNVDLLSTITASSYNSTYQSITTPAVLYNGHLTNGTYYGVFSGNASSSYGLYNDSYTSGEALIANDLMFLQTDNKWYKANISGRNIPFGTLIGRCGGSYAINIVVASYLYGRYSLPTGITGVLGKDIFIRGSIANGVFTTDGTITTTIAAGYSYIRIGSAIYNTGTIQYDGNNRVYSITNDGINAIDGINIDVPTKLSELANDIGAGGGTLITTSGSEPTATKAGDFWYKEV